VILLKAEGNVVTALTPVAVELGPLPERDRTSGVVSVTLNAEAQMLPVTDRGELAELAARRQQRDVQRTGDRDADEFWGWLGAGCALSAASSVNTALFPPLGIGFYTADILRLGAALLWLTGCGREIASQSLERILDLVMLYPNDARINVLAPVVRGRKGEFKKELQALRQRGFAKARIDGQFRSLDEDIKLDRRRNHNIDIVVDRLIVKSGIERRLSESLETALGLADDIVVINTYEGGDQLFSRRLACVACGISMPEMTPRASRRLKTCDALMHWS